MITSDQILDCLTKNLKLYCVTAFPDFQLGKITILTNLLEEFNTKRNKKSSKSMDTAKVTYN